MNFLHIVLQVIQFICAGLLIAVVMSQTTKDQGMGGALGGGQGGAGGGSRYSGGYEEKLDMTARNLVIGFLVSSLLVAVIGHMIS